MLWYIIAAGVPNGSQIVAVQAPKKSVAIQHAVKEVKKALSLPSSYTVQPRVLTSVETEEEATDFLDRLHKALEEERAKQQERPEIDGGSS